MDETSLRTLVDTNASRFKEKGDSLVVFTHWFLRKYTFDLLQNDKIDNEFDINTRGPDGGFGLLYVINGHKMDVRILRSDIFITIYFIPPDAYPAVNFKLKIESHIKREQHEEINAMKNLEKIFKEKLFSIKGQIGIELKKILIASSSDACTGGGGSIDTCTGGSGSIDTCTGGGEPFDTCTGGGGSTDACTGGGASIDDVLEQGTLSPKTQDSINQYVTKTP